MTGGAAFRAEIRGRWWWKGFFLVTAFQRNQREIQILFFLADYRVGRQAWLAGDAADDVCGHYFLWPRR